MNAVNGLVFYCSISIPKQIQAPVFLQQGSGTNQPLTSTSPHYPALIIPQHYHEPRHKPYQWPAAFYAAALGFPCPLTVGGELMSKDFKVECKAPKVCST